MGLYQRDILERVENFVVDVVEFSRKFSKDTAAYSIAKQLIDAAGSIGANIVEARNARSRKEFASSLGISFKEAKETRYWLGISGRCNLGDKEYGVNLSKECDEICKILGKSVSKLRGHC